jgi:hypothetical protein
MSYVGAVWSASSAWAATLNAAGLRLARININASNNLLVAFVVFIVFVLRDETVV